MKLRVAFDGGDTIEVEAGWPEVLRIERFTGVPFPELSRRGFVGTAYRLAWLALQRAQHPAVLPHVDLRVVPALFMDAGAEALADIATVEFG